MEAIARSEVIVSVGTDGFEAYVRRRADALWRAAWLLTGDEGQAEDLVQTALAKTWHRFGQFDNEHHFESYVRTTLYRTFVSWWRRRRWRTEELLDVHPVLDGAGTEVRLDMMRALRSLNRVQRTVLVMRFFEDKSVAEVAEALGMPENTVKTHTRRAVAAVRDSIHLKHPEE